MIGITLNLSLKNIAKGYRKFQNIASQLPLDEHLTKLLHNSQNQ